MLGFPLLAVHRHIVAVIDDEGGQHGEVEQPFLADYPVIGIASADTEVTEVNLSQG